jgi:multimeric flavodoxin WrbA
MASARKTRAVPEVRTGQGSVALSKDEFRARWMARHFDPAFEKERDALERLLEVAWEAYQEDRKNPRTRRAGRGFADPGADLPVEWLAARDAIRSAQRKQSSRTGPSRVLLVCGASRSDQTCPGEMSKTFRMTEWARAAIESRDGFEVDLLDLSRLASEYGRVIYPCKACVSTAMPLCHWPCSCYPNHGQGQSGDWMNEIYLRWVAAHGVMIVTPVYWYQAPSGLKLMMDRLVCADGGNPDPTTTGGKDPVKAKALELAGWHYPRHLAGRAFSVVVHGDAAGAENLRRMLADWLSDMELVPAGPHAGLDRYVGYFEPYATSHDALDRDQDLRREVENRAHALAETVRQIRAGSYRRPDEGLDPPRPK